jgi:hypothetical protein
VTNTGTSSNAVLAFGIPAGAPGAPGSNGTNGTAATVAVGTVTGLAAGATPTVTNSGSTSAAVFNFGIPAGAPGATGATGNITGVSYLSPGTYTWTVPTGVTKARFEGWGGAGGGGNPNAGSNGTGGGSGAYFLVEHTVTPGSTVTIVVGNFGITGTQNATATTVTIGTDVATAGAGANGNNSGAAVSGGTCSFSGTWNQLLTITGSAGNPCMNANMSGAGGSAPRGGSGGVPVGSYAFASRTNGYSGVIPGGGGSGGTYSGSAGTGGFGAPGMLVISY